MNVYVNLKNLVSQAELREASLIGVKFGQNKLSLNMFDLVKQSYVRLS